MFSRVENIIKVFKGRKYFGIAHLKYTASREEISYECFAEILRNFCSKTNVFIENHSFINNGFIVVEFKYFSEHYNKYLTFLEVIDEK